MVFFVGVEGVDFDGDIVVVDVGFLFGKVDYDGYWFLWGNFWVLEVFVGFYVF